MYEKTLFELVKTIQTKGNENAMLKLIKEFQPLIKKYSYLVDYENSESELTLTFIKTLYKIPINNPKFKQDKYIISYINKSIRNKYIYLSKNRNKIYYYESPINLDITQTPYQTNIGNKLFINDLLLTLTKREREIINLKYFKEYSDIEISKKFGISRQAVNKTKNIAITKMRKYILSN
ncbi:sigma-70 family RNA polymerase sigma factor [Sporanaerobacter acetigenes]|uniref:sigma-70 family RNA polymerase sigma factor n=1 Tax=Sporanaerobacter acetigenes TaxID=165813 RepID=UPI0010434DA1|nr:sigma-70 family RNA polymerase sigma factor [Sporanaerobacter acetigenes]